jgi:hypothetical protein
MSRRLPGNEILLDLLALRVTTNPTVTLVAK